MSKTSSIVFISTTKHTVDASAIPLDVWEGHRDKKHKLVWDYGGLVHEFSPEIVDNVIDQLKRQAQIKEKYPRYQRSPNHFLLSIADAPLSSVDIKDLRKDAEARYLPLHRQPRRPAKTN